MLLYCCWIGRYVGKFGSELFGNAIEFSTCWSDNVVVPLRSARTWMKHTGCHTGSVPTTACMDLRETIKCVELTSEKLQQRALASLISTGKLRNDTSIRIRENATANLNLYSEHKGFDVGEDVQRQFSVIVKAAFPDE